MKRCPSDLKGKKISASALVITLSAVVLISGLILAFFSRAALNRQISFSSTNLVKVDVLAKGGLDHIVGELREEIRNGSKTPPAGVDLFSPNISGTNNTLAPARFGGNVTEKNLVRTSTSDAAAVAAAFSDTNLYSSAPPTLASPVSTTAPSMNGRTIPRSCWEIIQLLFNPASAPSPDWVLVTRNGPKRFTAAAAIQGDKSSADYVIGRYAYAIYDEGSLLDATVAGYPAGTSASDIGKKGPASFADLTSIPGLNAALSDWRNQHSKSTYSSTVFDFLAPNGFNRVLGTATASDNTFTSRADLIQYASTAGISADALRFLGTSNVECNSPAIPAGADATLNPEFGTLISPVTGKPLQRFALSRFKLLEQNPASLTQAARDKIREFFGLTPGTGASDSYRVWNYHSATIGTPQQAIAAGREPDLFELVKAAIANGSLGVNASQSTNTTGMQIRDGVNGASNAYTAEANVHHQVARIIANMIDQSDADNYPTTIVLGDNPVSNTVYGIEHLPYFSELMLKLYFPSGSLTNATGATFSHYFELWDPHRGSAPAVGPAQVRIVVNPEAGYGFSYLYHINPNNPGNLRDCIWGTTLPPYHSFAASYTAAGGGITVPSLSLYSEPTTVSTPMALDPPTIGMPTSYPINASRLFINWNSLNLVFSLQYQDAAGSWHTYTTFAGHDNDGGATGIQNTGVYTYNYSRYFIAGIDQPNLVLPKPDPRTFHFRTGTSSNNPGSTSYNSGMVSAADQGQPITEKIPAFYNITSPSPANNVKAYPGMLYKNTGGTNGVKAKDYDGVVRVGDGYLGSAANPMASASSAARPVILNRPFRSVGELGYVFRDVPWKSLNLFSSDSGDAALLELFCVEEAPLVAGKTNLNTPHLEVLKSLLSGASWDELTHIPIPSADVNTLATDLLAHSLASPFLNRADLVTKFSEYSGNSAASAFPAIKTQRESVVRALASSTQTRTWNLLIDLVAQVGRYPANPTSLEKFVVEGQSHCWLHVSIDRYTGQVLRTQMEVINE